MPDHDATMTVISSHVIESEEPISHPYPDIKGHVTIGVGFKIETEDEFAALNLQVINNDVPTPATDAEKRAAFRKLQQIAHNPETNLNNKASEYGGVTNIRMPEGAIQARLEQEINTRIDDIKKDVGSDAWDKLNDAQKAAAVDIHYANGSLNDFPAFRKAVQAGDAQRMADEPPFYTDEANGKRDITRLQRNYEALSGLRPAQARIALDARLDGLDMARADEQPSTLDNTMPKRKPDLAHVDEAIEEPPSPEAQQLFEDMTAPVDAIDNLLLKRDLTEGELGTLMKSPDYLAPPSLRHRAVQARVSDWFSDRYGDEPLAYDAAGRMRDPAVIAEAPEQALSATDGRGRSVDAMLTHFAAQVRKASTHETVPGAVKILQRTLNGNPENKAARLKIDGVVGPRTRSALRSAITEQGSSDMSEAFALNRFKGFTGAVASGKRRVDDLPAEAKHSFADLYPQPDPEDKNGDRDRPWSDGIQQTINQFASSTPELKAQKPLRLDAVIGPRTTGAFQALSRHVPAADFAMQLGRNLGFFGDR